MNDLEVRIITLPPQRVASFNGFGASPELEAQEKMLTWAQSKGLIHGALLPHVYGFDNPSPTPGSPNYGYDCWFEVGPEVTDDTVTFIDHPGGLYAVARCQGIEAIYPTWQKLVAWCEQSSYQIGAGQCLEEHVRFLGLPVEEYVMDLMLPLRA